DYVDLFTLLAESGLRIGEALHLRWCDIALGHDEGSYLRVQPWGEWTPKTKKSIRNVPLSLAVETMLRTRLRAKADVDPKACIFPATWTNGGVCQYFNKMLKRACLHERDERDQKLRVHSFRHYYASTLVRSGADPATVRDLLGHVSVVTTNRYFNVPRSELFAATAGAFSRTRSVHESNGLYRFPAEKESHASTR
ncbi:MAG: site-specific integrase, partial [Candidatus Hydrogenedentes bacterium]|nr:site-specific integrase [Candidatus Hydrogenedentota bacterium]